MDVLLPMFQLLYVVSHFLVSLALSTLDTLLVLHRFLMTWVYGREVSAWQLECDAARLKKIPTHLGLICIHRHSSDVNNLAALITWAMAYGVRYVSVYDVRGEVRRRRWELREALDRAGCHNCSFSHLSSHQLPCEPLNSQLKPLGTSAFQEKLQEPSGNQETLDNHGKIQETSGNQVEIEEKIKEASKNQRKIQGKIQEASQIQMEIQETGHEKPINSLQNTSSCGSDTRIYQSDTRYQNDTIKYQDDTSSQQNDTSYQIETRKYLNDTSSFQNDTRKYQNDTRYENSTRSSRNDTRLYQNTPSQYLDTSNNHRPYTTQLNDPLHLNDRNYSHETGSEVRLRHPLSRNDGGCYGDNELRAQLTINLLSLSDGRSNLANAAAKISLQGDHPNATNVPPCLLTFGQPDPEMAVTVGEPLATLGFLPWQTLLTEFFTLSRVDYVSFRNAMWKYSKVEQRYGK